MIFPTFLVALGFAMIHILIGRLRFLDAVPRSRWLSFAGGVAVAYIFLHVLPELAARRSTLDEHAPTLLAERSTFLIGLVGLAVFYGLERAMKAAGGDEARPEILWLHAGSFALYNLLIGYLLLHREEAGGWSLVLYAAAMALHFLTADFGLRQDYARRYDEKVRWILAASVLLGWGVGIVVDVHEAAVTGLFAFLAGGVILNVMKEELPEERKSRFVPFLAGAVAFSALALAVGE